MEQTDSLATESTSGNHGNSNAELQSEYMMQHESYKWKLNQVFGEDPTSVNEENVITSVEFDPLGDYLAIGYQCGQIVIFRKQPGTETFKFHTQFESHQSEFDCLTSVEIEEKITSIRWLKDVYGNNSRMMLSANDKTVKLWKMYEKNARISGSRGLPTDLALRRTFSNAHAYNINSISLSNDREHFLTADDLRINLWNLEVASECFTMVDSKPVNMNELNEVITSAEFHPQDAHNFIHASSKGFVKMVDMRNHALCDKTVKVFSDKKEKKSFFSEVIGSISDVKYSHDGRYILARDYLKLKIWDVNMESEPVKVLEVHEHIKSKLYELYENDGLFDKFECSYSSNSRHAVTGSYSNNFAIFDTVTGEGKYLQAVNPRDRKKKRSDTINFGEKISHTAWHPANNLVAVAAQNYIYLYHLAKP